MNHPCISYKSHSIFNRFTSFLLYFFGVLAVLIVIMVLCRVAEGAEIDISTIITIESNHNPRAISQDNCRGLMQISEIVLKEYNQAMFLCDVYKPDDLYDPALNMSVGTWYITEQIPRYLKNYNIPDTADNRLIAYNWGIGNLKKWWFSGADYKKLPKETRNYLLKYTRLGKR